MRSFTKEEVAVFWVFQELRMPVIGAFVLPHGGIAINPEHFETPNKTSKDEVRALNKSCKEVGQEIASLSPDLIFLSTPHGVSDLKNFSFYLNPTAEGNSLTDGCTCESCCHTVRANLAPDIAEDITKKLMDDGKCVSGIGGLGRLDDHPFLLGWGEVIPLYFIPNVSQTKVLIMSHPRRCGKDTVQMIPELLDLGKNIYKYLNNLSEKVVVIISGDLGHAHDKDGPYGFSSTAAPFDKACEDWARNLDERSLLNTAADNVSTALSCGYTGLVMLHGMLSEGWLTSWKPRVYANYHPSYFGMIVSSFTKICIDSSEIITIP